MMGGKEKLYFLLNRIDDARTITPAGQPLIIDPTNNLNQNYRDIELVQLFTKLAKDEQVLKVLKVPNRVKNELEEFDPYDHADDGCWHIELLSAFDSYFLKIQQEPEYQEYSGKKSAGSPTKSNGNTLITYEEKLDLVVKAVLEASKAIRKGVFTATLYLNATNGLDRLPREEINNILLQLQDEKALNVHPLNNRLLPPNQQPTHYFLLDILGFNDWHSRFLLKEKGKLENLSKLNFDNIAYVVSLIEQELEISQKEKVTVNFVYAVSEVEGYESDDIDQLIDTYTRALSYLKNIEVVKNFTSGSSNLYSEITLNIPKFLEILEKVKTLQQQTSPTPTQTQKTPVSQVMTENKSKVFYDNQKGILKIEDKKVKFNKESFRAKLLELLLKDDKSRKKEWSWDEVIEAIEDTKDKETTKENKNKFYPACDGLTKHIASKIGINDLLTFTISTVQINPKYH